MFVHLILRPVFPTLAINGAKTSYVYGLGNKWTNQNS